MLCEAKFRPRCSQNEGENQRYGLSLMSQKGRKGEARTTEELTLSWGQWSRSHRISLSDGLASGHCSKRNGAKSGPAVFDRRAESGGVEWRGNAQRPLATPTVHKPEERNRDVDRDFDNNANYTRSVFATSVLH